MHAAGLPPEIQEIVDRQAISDQIYTYCRAIDRCDAELLRSCYHEDAVEDRSGFFVGPRDEWIEWVIGVLTNHVDVSTHMICNMLIELDGDEAHVESYLLALHLRPAEEGGKALDWLAGRLVDRFERRTGSWKVARRALTVDWTHTEPAVDAYGDGIPGDTPGAEAFKLRRGLRTREDLAYRESAQRFFGS